MHINRLTSTVLPLTALLTVLSLPIHALADTSIISASADTHVSGWAPDSKFDKTIIFVSSRSEGPAIGLVKFDITQSPATVVESAQLHFYVKRVIKPGNISFHLITEPWIEHETNFKLMPMFVSNRFNSFSLDSNDAKKWHSIDLTEVVQGWADGSIQNYGVVVRSDAAAVVLYSREVKPPHPMQVELVTRNANTDDREVQVTQAPQVVMNPNDVTPLAGTVRFQTNRPVKASLDISDGQTNTSVDIPGYRTIHDLPLLGLKPNTTYTIKLIITDRLDRALHVEPALYAITPALPPDFPTITVSVADETRMEPGFTLVDHFVRRPGPAPPGAQGYTIILDNLGDVVWYSPLHLTHGVRQQVTGNLIANLSGAPREIDLLGNTSKKFPPEVGQLHHDLLPTVYGTYMSFTRETAPVDDFPTNYKDIFATATADVQDNPLIEFYSTGAVANRWRFTEMLDPRRIGYDALNTMNGKSAGFDWAHSNSVVHDRQNDSLIVSLRNQDAIVKFSRLTGEVKWILGTHANWGVDFEHLLLTPVGNNFQWQYHQHAAMLTPNNTLLLFDNGNYRSSPFDGLKKTADAKNYSRVVEYLVNEENMTIEQVWEYGRDLGLFTNKVGDADWMTNAGNVLITYGAVSYDGGIPVSELGHGGMYVRIVEVTHSSPAEEVFDVMLSFPGETSGVQTYRSERIPSLYPPAWFN